MSLEVSEMTDEKLLLKLRVSSIIRRYDGLQDKVLELINRYNAMKALARGAVHGKGCMCPNCAGIFD